MTLSPLPTLAAFLLLVSGAAASASSAWTISSEGARTMLSFGSTGSAAPTMRFACGPAGASVFVPTRAPRFGVTTGEPTPSNLSLIIGSTEAIVPSTLSRTEAGWQVVGPVPDVPRLITAWRNNRRFSIIHHAGRAKAPSPAADLLDRFETACMPAGFTR